MSWSTPSSAKVVTMKACLGGEVPPGRWELIHALHSSTGAGAPIRRRGPVQDTGRALRDAATPVSSRIRGLAWRPWSRGSGSAPARAANAPSRCAHAAISGDATRVDFEELAPDVDTFLGQAAYLQLGFFETLSELIASTPELAEKESLSRAAGAALTKHEELVALIRERGDDPTALMLPFREPLDAFRARDARRAAAGDDAVGAHHRGHARRLLSRAVGELRRHRPPGREDPPRRRRPARRSSTSSPRRSRATRSGSRCSRCGGGGWSATPCSSRAPRCVPGRLRLADEEKVEPVFTELMAAHSRRMDAMGLAA